MTAAQLMLPANRAFDSNGFPEAGATVKLYQSGTTTPANFYADAALTIVLGSTLTANAAGRIVTPAYQDRLTPFRLKVFDAAGDELDDIDPFYFGSTYTTVVSTASTNVATRTAMAAIVGVAGAVVNLTESGREGTFVFDSTNFVTKFGAPLTTIDPQQRKYVAPSSDTTGASGAWVRDESFGMNVLNAGAVASTTVDSNAAFQNVSVEDRGHSIRIPASQYRISATSTYRGLVNIKGDGWGQNPGTVDGVSYPYPTFFNGSVIYSDANITGLEFQPFTSQTDVATVNASPSTYYTQQSAYGSRVSDLAIVSAGNGAVHAGKYGIFTRTRVDLENVLIYGHGDDGVHIEATTVVDGNQYGNANTFRITGLESNANAGEGLSITGSDANAGYTIGFSASNNTGYGLRDESLIGNTHIAPHFAANTLGAIKTGASNPVVIVGPYIETGAGATADIGSRTMVIGGIGAGESYYAASSPGFVMNGPTAHCAGYSGKNRLGATAVQATIGRDPSMVAGTALSFGSADNTATMDAFRLTYQFQWSNIWTLTYSNSAAAQILEFINGGHASASLANGYALGLPNGHYMGSAQSAPRFLPAATAAPVSGTYRTGDIVPNSTPTTGTPVLWRCTAGGAPGTWVACYGVNALQTGWVADTGTAKRTANATYTKGATLTYSATYVQSEQTAMATRMAAVEQALQDAMQTIKALKDDLLAAKAGISV